ncbi:hypothetical protein WS48_17935 [Burkholderia sp. RF7-non_BP1]|nr:hypothetical protein [Burkholderia sp. BCC1630]KUY85963.1 hypothetical protein WS46_05195 [Burkholderia sp. RF4-BP95]KUY92839.1 hypothetical protein WS49_26340 [Burkholderia sp. RF7-non_BP4]KUY95346.1 hypothetical protein WS48_17935 [Burkholderia sp. RF7-non_BP1]
MKAERSVSVSIGDGVVTIKRDGSSTATVAGVLGKVTKGDAEVICLDRLVHQPYETEFVGWKVSGAVTTLLSRSFTGEGAA